MVILPPLVAEVARLLVDGGKLFVQTDVDFRSEAYREILSANPSLTPATTDGTIDHNPFGARSPREMRCRETGLPIYRLLFEKIRRTESLPRMPGN